MKDEEIWNLIEEKYSDKSNYTKRFIFDSIKRFGDIFDYYKTNRVDNNLTKVVITCRIHGDFEIDPQYFLKSKYCHGCPKCNPGKTTKKTLEQVEKEVKELFPQFVLLPGQIYTGNNCYLKFKCKIHGKEFSTKVSNLLVGKCPCKLCSYDNKRKTKFKTLENKLIEAIRSYDLNIDTNLIEYRGNSNKVILSCKIHNISFELTPIEIYQKISNKLKLCPDCRKLEYNLARKNNFIRKGIEIWKDRYNFDNLTYVNENNITGIVCTKCGTELGNVRSNNFFRGQVKCSCHGYRGETFVEEYLKSNEVFYNKNVSIGYISGRKLGSKVEIDFIAKINDKEFWIECDGEQHYMWVKKFQPTIQDFSNQLQRDTNIYNYCKESGIIFIKIPYGYYNFDKIKDVLDKVLKNNLSPFEFIKYPKINYPDCYKGEKIQYGI